MHRYRTTTVDSCGDPNLRRGWQHDGRDPLNPAMPGVLPQKVPGSL